MADEDLHLHNHPWTWCKPFRVSGKYFESFATLENPTEKLRVGGKTSMVQTDYHKIHSVLDKPVISLFFAGRRVDNWGYLTESGHVDHKKYRRDKQSPISFPEPIFPEPVGKIFYIDFNHQKNID
jgi:hypothetical protein